MGIREEVYYEGGPHIGDLILNIAIGVFIVTLPLTVGAIVRAIWLRYRITDRRISVTGGWRGQDRSDVIYTEIVKVNKIPRGLGIWGDMVLVLKDGSKLELRSVPQFREVYTYIQERIAQRTKKPIEA
jgi:nitrogen fixation protein